MRLFPHGGTVVEVVVVVVVIVVVVVGTLAGWRHWHSPSQIWGDSQEFRPNGGSHCSPLLMSRVPSPHRDRSAANFRVKSRALSLPTNRLQSSRILAFRRTGP
jgi:hypothetical protein